MIAEEFGTKGNFSRARLHNDRNDSVEKGQGMAQERRKQEEYSWSRQEDVESLPSPSSPILRSRMPLLPSRAHL